MADQSVRVENDSKERVMFDLMNVIAANEQGAKDRKYFFTLFLQCHKAIHSYDLNKILETEPPRR